MKIIRNITEMREFAEQAKAAGKTVGLVPTLGGMHDGHISLIDAAMAECDEVVVSIFLNPTQFAPTEDLDAYPLTPESDHKACEARGVAAIFEPSPEEMYGDGAVTQVIVSELTETLCGRSRPIHFAGVCTVVSKLFNIIPAQKAYFGDKDYQQAAVIRRMVADLNIPVEIVTCPIVREADGLAMSSRNANLSADERKQATALYGALQMAAEMIAAEHPPAEQIVAAIREYLGERAPLGEIDYAQIVDPETLADVVSTERPVQIALAVQFGRARLIDNMRVDPGGVVN
jgi:pantoate--beta-alanine ligase